MSKIYMEFDETKQDFNICFFKPRKLRIDQVDWS